MSKADKLLQLSLFPEMTKNEPGHVKALIDRARDLQDYWFECVQSQHAPTPELGFFVELCRRHSKQDVRRAIQLTTSKIRDSSLAWEQAEQDCRKTANCVVLERVKQEIAAAEGKPATPASGVAIPRRLHGFIRSA